MSMCSWTPCALALISHELSPLYLSLLTYEMGLIVLAPHPPPNPRLTGVARHKVLRV